MGWDVNEQDRLDWSVDVIKHEANKSRVGEKSSRSTREIFVTDVYAAKKDGSKKTIIVVKYKDEYTQNGSHFVSLYSNEGAYIANTIEVNCCFTLTSEKQDNGYWAWVKLQKAELKSFDPNIVYELIAANPNSKQLTAHEVACELARYVENGDSNV